MTAVACFPLQCRFAVAGVMSSSFLVSDCITQHGLSQLVDDNKPGSNLNSSRAEDLVSGMVPHNPHSKLIEVKNVCVCSAGDSLQAS